MYIHVRCLPVVRELWHPVIEDRTLVVVGVHVSCFTPAGGTGVYSVWPSIFKFGTSQSSLVAGKYLRQVSIVL